MTIQQEFQVVVLAAGRGSRMPELTAEKPKCLLPIGSKPMVWYPLYKLQQSGFTETILVVNENQKQEIQLALEGKDLDIKIEYFCIENRDEKGTADSLCLLHEKIKRDVIIMSCDLITNVDLGDVLNLFRKHDASICSLLFQPQNTDQIVVPGPKAKHKPERDLIGIDSQTNRLVFLASASDFENNVTLPKSMMKKHTNITMYSSLIDSHFYVMKNWVLKYLKYLNSESVISTLKGEFIPHIIRKQLINFSKESGDVNNSIFNFIKRSELSDAVRQASSYTDHYGDMKDCYHGDMIRCYAHIANQDAFGLRVNTLPTYWSLNGKIQENWETLIKGIPDVLVDCKADVKSSQVDKCYIWASASLKEKTSFRNSVIGLNTSVESLTKVLNSIVMNNVTIHSKVSLENCIVCDGAVIETNCQLKGCLIGSNHVVKQGSVHDNEILTDSDKLMEFE